ncbi:Uncharacterised protein [Salmonella enterica subsp. enterica serovar Bovismorbificans]|uniref:Uncharacterized protein n=1 Tax=Salmonella enterica subsp. enterica serovar Bovismorbificans TaxID=58097 RepID=A0A655E456_SALET|nr:Uncharacterised protein [Salmonella enterica subsp. enterica serovar Bovismorbificans]
MIQRFAKQAFGCRVNRFLIGIRQRLRQPVIDEKFFPEATTLAHRGKLLFHSGAELPGIARDLPQMLRQQRFQFLAQQTRQHRGGAARGDGDHQRRAVNNGGHDKAGGFRRIHHVAKDTA